MADIRRIFTEFPPSVLRVFNSEDRTHPRWQISAGYRADGGKFSGRNRFLSLFSLVAKLELDGTGFVQKEFIRLEIGFSTQEDSGEGVVEQVKGPNGYRDHPLLNIFESFFLQEAEMTERRENEMEALKSIFNTDLVDLRYLLYLWYLSYRPG